MGKLIDVTDRSAVLRLQEFATLVKPETKEDIAINLLNDGYAMVEKRKEKRLQKLLVNYRKAQEKAKANRVC